MIYPKQSATVHAETLNDELCLYDWQRKEVHALNSIAAKVWHLCDGRTSPAQMATQLMTELPADLHAKQAEELVWMSLEKLETAHLLAEQGSSAILTRPRLISRRQFLKMLGGVTGGVIVLPVVTSILAPTPVQAQSPIFPPIFPPIILYNAGGTFNGNLVGRAGADGLCQASANAPAGYTNFRAFISVSATDEIQDMPANYGVPTTVAIQSSGGTVIANDWADLLDGTIDTTLAAAGVIGLGHRFWSGSNADGSLNPDNCNSWTDGGGILRGENGHASFSDSNWLSEGGPSPSCNGLFQLLCIAF
jgi:hypothetical protein